MSILCMKTRTYILLLAALLGSLTFSLFAIRNDPANPTWNNIVSETQKQLNNLKKFNEKPGIHKIREVEPYLQKLGLEDPEKSAFSEEELSKLLPTIAIPVKSGEGSSAINCLKSIRQWLPGYSVQIYDLGLGYFEKKTVKQSCNRTVGVSCRYVSFQWSAYPSYVSEMKYGAYRPIIIQEVLNSSGAVFYLSPNHRITSSNIDSALNLSRTVGVAAWPLLDSTSAITHNKVYTFFHTSEEKFYFHRTVSSHRLLIYATPKVRKQLMLPWLQCALTFHCVAPIGAQETGCRTYRKPLFLYSGCHGYDWSVMNIVLGLMFQFEAAPYMAEPSSANLIEDNEEIHDEQKLESMVTHAFFVTDEKILEKLKAEQQSSSSIAAENTEVSHRV